MHRIVALLIAISVSTFAFSSQTRGVRRLDGSTIAPAEIDATVNRLIKAADVTGAGIGMIDRGKIIYLKSYGLRDKEKNLPLTPDSVMTAASLTKTALAIW